MATPLLHTKIHIPRTMPNVLPRPALIDSLQDATSGRLTLISAPAGSGKTTLLSQWITDRKPKVAWVSLDERDNDLKRFLAYLLTALERVEVHIDEENLTSLISPGGVEVEAIAASIMNQILQGDERFVLVLDDYHSITARGVHDLVEYILQNMPHNMHLILATRADPPLRLGRLRAAGDLVEVRLADLRFEGEWVDKYLREVHGLTLSTEDVRKLEHRTEGWVAGLQLASLAMKNADDIRGFIDHFSGGHTYVAEYLTDEVLRGLDHEVQDFLLSTSLLDRLTAPLCDFVREAGDSLGILKRLDEANIFLVPLDSEGIWFRYHHLFADLLQKQLHEKQTEAAVFKLYERASQWCEEQGLIPEAVEYALQGQLRVRSLDLLDPIVEGMIRKGEIDSFMGWAGQLPEELIATRPNVAVFYAWVLLFRGEDPNVPDAILGALTPASDAAAGRIHAVESLNAFFSRRDLRDAELQARQALRLLPEEDVFFRNMAVYNLSGVYYLQGRRREGLELLYESAEMGRKSGNVLLAVTALCRIGTIQLHIGELFEAKRLFDQALDLARDQEGYVLPVAFAAKLGLGKIYRAWNEPEKARDHLEDALRKGAQGRLSYAIEAHDTLAFVQESLGHSVEATELIGKAADLASQTEMTQSDDAYIASQAALLSIRQDRIGDAELWASTRALDERLEQDANAELSPGERIIRLYETMVYARLLLAKNRSKEALRVLDQLDFERAEQIPTSKQIECLLLSSLTYDRLNRRQEALTQLQLALELAQPGNELGLFLDEGRHLFNLLVQLDAQPATEPFQAQIQGSFEAQYAEGEDRDRSEVLIETLTNREAEVLQFLLTELTVPEIAKELYIAESTVRTHIKNLYGKLGVHSRFEAVVRARELELL